MKKFYFVFLLLFFIASCGGTNNESTTQATVSTGFRKGIKSFQLTSSKNVVYNSEVTVTVSVEFTKKTSQPAILTLSLNGSTILTEEISVSNGTDYSEILKVPLEDGSNIIVVKIQYLDSVVSDFVAVNYVDSSIADFMGSINITSTGYRVFYLDDSIHAKVTDVTISYNTTLPVSIENIKMSLDQGKSWISVRDYFSEKSQGMGYYAEYVTFSHLDIGQFKPLVKVTGKVNGESFSVISDVGVDGYIFPRIEFRYINVDVLYANRPNFVVVNGWFGKDPEEHFGGGIAFIYEDENSHWVPKLNEDLFIESATERKITFSFWLPPSTGDSNSSNYLSCNGSMCSANFYFNMDGNAMFAGRFSQDGNHFYYMYERIE